MRRNLIRLTVLALLVLGALLLYGRAQRHPEDMPWTALDLGQPIGAFTGRKLAELDDDAPRCIALLARAGVRFTVLPGRAQGPRCGYGHAVRFTPGGAATIGYRPADVATNCAVAAGLALWEWHIVQPAARRHFGRAVTGITHFGSYSCRRMYARASGPWSEHATANAIDVAGFLSPDYNAAHYNHLHLDQAPRGVSANRSRFRTCSTRSFVTRVKALMIVRGSR